MDLTIVAGGARQRTVLTTSTSLRGSAGSIAGPAHNAIAASRPPLRTLSPGAR
ncbi:hypothetical protein [Nonomuraea dietziae]|uniref:hypothetical protein n=1 Tax=Nonomuraea dietziae TaxID=65515 RepID=UPI0033F67239